MATDSEIINFIITKDAVGCSVSLTIQMTHTHGCHLGRDFFQIKPKSRSHLSPGHQYSECWVRTNTFPAVKWLIGIQTSYLNLRWLEGNLLKLHIIFRLYAIVALLVLKCKLSAILSNWNKHSGWGHRMTMETISHIIRIDKKRVGSMVENGVKLWQDFRSIFVKNRIFYGLWMITWNEN